MIIVSVIIFSVCAVICVSINAVKALILEDKRNEYRATASALTYAIKKFEEEFNNTYSNTKIVVDITPEKGIVIKAEDVEP